MLLLAAGIGITPLRALLEDTDYAPGEATLVYRYSRDQHAVFTDELRALAARRGIELVFLPGPRGAETSWQAAGTAPGTDDVRALRNLVPDIEHCDIYACGPPGWLTAVRRAARGAGAHRDHLHTEEFGW
jgi:ferredoxin-NADP reductase